MAVYGCYLAGGDREIGDEWTSSRCREVWNGLKRTERHRYEYVEIDTSTGTSRIGRNDPIVMLRDADVEERYSLFTCYADGIVYRPHTRPIARYVAPPRAPREPVEAVFPLLRWGGALFQPTESDADRFWLEQPERANYVVFAVRHTRARFDFFNETLEGITERLLTPRFGIAWTRLWIVRREDFEPVYLTGWTPDGIIPGRLPLPATQWRALGISH